ncbi:MAG TPA: hypothetical protein VI282_04325 [Verrucomicrobiae bacterium]
MSLRRKPAPPDFLETEKVAAYSNLLNIAKQISGNPEGGSVSLPSLPVGMRARPQPGRESQRAEFIARNQGVFSALDTALSRPIEAPEAAYRREQLPLDDHIAIKVLSRALIAKGEDAELRGENKEAAQVYVTALRLGLAYEHGPLINFLIGSAIERISIRPLKTIIPKLADDELITIAEEIQSANRGRISFADVMRREEYYTALNTTNIIEYARVHFSPQLRSPVNKAAKIHRDLQTQLEGMSAAAGVLAYNRENNGSLTNLQSLIPRHLKLIPLDPYGYGRSPMRLLSTSTGSIPYSIGENKRDESGRGDDIPFFFVDGLSASK